MFELLLNDSRTNATAQTKRGMTCLHQAAISNSLRVLDVLLGSKKAVGFVNEHCVKLSNRYCCSQCTSLLNLENQWGETAMHLAAAAGHARVLEKLVGAGAQLNPEDKVVDHLNN